jgi:hypothetical protein
MQPKRLWIASALALASCSRAEPNKMDRGQAPGRETDPAVVATGAKPQASSAAVPSAEQHGTRIEGPREENMGRNFEGRLQWRVVGTGPDLNIRYLSRGERGRLQLERPGSGEAAFDAIFAGDQVIVLDHAQHRFRRQDLNQVPKKSEPKVDVTIEQTSDRREVQGLLCYPWQLTSGSQKIDACVRGAPGPVDTDKLETLSGKDIPAWVEELAERRYIAITATVSEGGRKLYELQLVQYSPDEVPENELAVPANYQQK